MGTIALRPILCTQLRTRHLARTIIQIRVNMVILAIAISATITLMPSIAMELCLHFKIIQIFISLSPVQAVFKKILL